MKIEDGEGSNGDMGVTASQRGKVSSRSSPRTLYAARDKGLSFSSIYTFTAASGDYVAYLKNTSSTKNMFIGDVSMGGVNSILWKFWFVTGTAAAGEAVTPIPTNHSKKIPAEATAMAGDTTITGLTTDGNFSVFRSAAASSFEEHFDGSTILGPGDAMMIEYDTGASGVGEIDIHFHYEDLDARLS
jgi:hypothetical protein